MMEDKIEEKLAEDDNCALCRFNKDTKGWEPIEDHCPHCGKKECGGKLCDCFDPFFSALAILKSAEAGGGEAPQPLPIK